MNFLRKFARDLQLSKRRQSAPDLVDEAHKHRSEEYMQAITDFNDWRKRNFASPQTMSKITEELNELFSARESPSSGEKSSPTYADIEEKHQEGENTPPEGFFRSNSIPDLAPSPRKSSAMPEKKPSRTKTHRKGRAPPPPPRRFDANAPLPKVKKVRSTSKSCLNPVESEKDGEETDGTRFSGKYKRFDVDSDDCVKNEKNIPKKYPRRQPTGPIQLNPVSEKNVAQYDEVIDEGFRFLSEKYGCFIDSTVESHFGNGPVPVTDLDKSDDPASSDDPNRKDFSSSLGEHDNQEMPTNSVQQSFDVSVIDPFYTRFQDFFRTQNVIVCWPNEIFHRKAAPRSTMLTPLEFSTGVFRNSMVSVRKYSLGEGKDYKFAEVASRRDYEILNYLRHPDVGVLMAVNLDRGLNQINLVMEPFDFTLNYFLYKCNREFPVCDTISIIQQLSSAVQYLHECGYVHSNISSHAIMMRLHPVCVKLTSFELATSVKYDIKKQLEQTYGRQGYYNKPKTIPRMSDTVDKEKYMKMSRQIHSPKIVPTVRATRVDRIDPKHIPYFQGYRQKFSLHYYQAPELVKAKAIFVVPRKESDVYSLTVLLWEMLNRCVPYVMYSYEELEAIHATGRSNIPIIDEERCRFFDEVLSMGLEPRPEERFIFPPHFASLLEDVRCLVQEKEARENLAKEEADQEPPKSPQNPNVDSRKSDKVSSKEIDLARMEAIFNSVTLESVDHSVFPGEKEVPEVVEKADSCIEELLDGNFNERIQRNNSQRTNGELSLSIASLGKSDSARKRRSVLYSQLYEDKANDPFFNLSQSTIFNSNVDFHNKLLETAKQGDRLERTSTTKKKKSRVFERAMDIFSGAPTKSRRNLNDNLDSAAQEEIAIEKDSQKSEDEEVKNSSKTSGFVERAKAKLEKCILNGSKNCSSEEDLVAATEKSAKKTSTITMKLDSYPEDFEKEKKIFSPSKYSFNVGRCDLPKTTIARKNKLRRYAWLSEKRPSVSPNGSSFNFLSDESVQAKENVPVPQCFHFAKDGKGFTADVSVDERRGSTCNISLDNSFRERKVNVNLKVKHNNQEIFSNSFTSEEDLEAIVGEKISQIHVDMFKNVQNVGQANPSLKPKIEIKMIGHRGNESCEIQREILDISAQIVEHFEKTDLDGTMEKSSFERDSRRMMIVRPEVLQTAIRKQRKSTREDLEHFENSLWHREKSLCEKTSYNGSLADESDAEDAENCSGLANKKGTQSACGGQEAKNDTEDLYIDDDLSLWPSLSVNIDLDLIKGDHK